MPLHSFGQQENSGGFDWMTGGGAAAALIGLGMSVFGLQKKDLVIGISGLALAGGGGFMLYQGISEDDGGVPLITFDITEARFSNSTEGWGDWEIP